MSPEIREILVGESQIELKVVIPVNLGAQGPLEHLANEGKLREGLRLAGQAATQALYQRIADGRNGWRGYYSPEGYWMKSEGESKVSYASPYGPITVSRTYFYNGYIKEGVTPFEQDTRMEKHGLTPMLQFIVLRKLCEKGPEACAEALAEELGIKVSHHLLDRFLEDTGWEYEELRPEMVRAVIGRDWHPQWLPPVQAALPGQEAGEEQTGTPAEGAEAQRPPSQETVAEDKPLMDALSEETGRKAVPVVQTDAMTVTIRKYQADESAEAVDRRKYHTERHQLHNAVVGFVMPDGPREAGEKIELHAKRYFSEYFAAERLPEAAREYLEACGLKPGDLVVLNGDGAPKIWERNRDTFKDYRRVEILDERHCRANLREAAEHAYPEDEDKQREWVEKRMDDLYQGQYSRFFYGLQYLVKAAQDDASRERLRTKRAYFRTNQDRIRYKEFLESGYPISTCFVESAHRHVIGDRLRNNGRSYVEYRLQMIANFRSEYKSKRLAYVFEKLLEKAA